MAFDRELTIAQELAREAGAHAVRNFKLADVEVERKEAGEPVTRVDRECSEILLVGLRKHFPDDVHISEEAADDRARLEEERRVWFVDPIDGTSDFIRGRDGWSVMLGLAIAGRPVLGVVFQPVGDFLYRAIVGGQAQVVGPAGPRDLAVSTHADVAKIRLVASRSHRTGKIDEVKQTLGIQDEFNVGSVGLKLGLIAQGVRDLYVNPATRCKTWDTCGPQAILEAAGGKLTDLHGEALSYTASDMTHTNGMIASNGALHAAVVEKLRPVFPA